VYTFAIRARRTRLAVGAAGALCAAGTGVALFTVGFTGSVLVALVVATDARAIDFVDLPLT
jgi:hypothetical protein